MNPLFRHQVASLFEKLAFSNPADVAASLHAQGRHGLAGHVQRGQQIIDTAASAGSHAVDAAKAVGSGAARVMAPLHAEGTALAKELGAAGAHLAQPRHLPLIAGSLMMAPILGSAFTAQQQRREDELMNLQMNPTQSKMSHLDRFLEKKAADYSKMAGGDSPPGFGPRWHEIVGTALKGHTQDSFASGLGQGVGGGIAQAILGAIGGGYHTLHNALIVDPRRQRLFESVVRTDPVIRDALSRTPHADKTLAEAFQTMVRFAPSLSLDVNAVRSFLREAVIGGAAGVNYATIKTLIETEKGLRAGDNR
jgi:hypothetical protein